MSLNKLIAEYDVAKAEKIKAMAALMAYLDSEESNDLRLAVRKTETRYNELRMAVKKELSIV